MLVVTGGAGFIGSRLVKGLNALGHENILIVDDLTDGKKFVNLLSSNFIDFIDKDRFIAEVRAGIWSGKIQGIFHQGACSETTEWNGKYLMENNYEYTKTLFHFSIEENIPFLYASSAAVYGDTKIFKEELAYERPLNMYGYSKWIFDQYLHQYENKLKSQVVGFRYFNVYGPGEQHKGGMASVAYHLHQQMRRDGVVRLFEGCEGYADGEQRRDFIHVDDVVKVILWFWKNPHPDRRGIFNLGTGRSQTFNEVANAVLQWHGTGELRYIPFPEHLKGAYQAFTQADMTKLHNIGYNAPFMDVEEGVRAYLAELNNKE